MKKSKSMKSRVLILFLSVFIIFSCSEKDDVDAQAPTVTIQRPVANAEFHRSDAAKMTIHLEDNEALKSCHIGLAFMNEISRINTTVLKGINEPWKPAEITLELSGMEVTKEMDLFESFIPVDILPGQYQLQVTCNDASDNETKATVNFTIL